ncbi:MAG: hypothetical protein BWX80_01789 [Candidatus Hydrogenedentes bacterium ADurb.Bin101]|nr:MAG: hypothetical protein BWX80_01789 [Candidatus Hydrogenedentes bacterium ADurb.Bin101]
MCRRGGRWRSGRRRLCPVAVVRVGAVLAGCRGGNPGPVLRGAAGFAGAGHADYGGLRVGGIRDRRPSCRATAGPGVAAARFQRAAARAGPGGPVVGPGRPGGGTALMLCPDQGGARGCPRCYACVFRFGHGGSGRAPVRLWPCPWLLGPPCFTGVSVAVWHAAATAGPPPQPQPGHCGSDGVRPFHGAVGGVHAGGHDL